MLGPRRDPPIFGVLLLAFLALAAPHPANAAGGGGGDGATTPARPEDPQYTAAVKAIKANEYAKAVPLLEGVVSRESNNADAYNWLAYATRKSGNPAASLPHYQKALAIDPRHRGAHEYIGEAYLMVGNVAKAREHLAALDKLCFFSCGEFRDLKRAIERHESAKKK
ncbi:MAG: tetratricopeptide repeat protein [Candidatus Rokuibacteriota bacterium]